MTDHEAAVRKAYWKRRLTGLVRVFFRFGLRIGTAHLLLLFIIALPVLHAVLRNKVPLWTLWIWVVLVILLQVVNIYQKGDARDDFERRSAIIQGSFAGNIDTLTSHLSRSESGRLSEAVGKLVCIGLLHRIRQYAALLLDAGVDTRLRATLAVPIIEAATGNVTHVRVWCYDEPYQDRRWSKIPIALPGSPTAFATGRIEIIRNLPELPGLAEFGQREYRSVVCIPVMTGGIDGSALGVVNLDAQPAEYFTAQDVERILPFIMPMVSCIALVLLKLDSDITFEFGG